MRTVDGYKDSLASVGCTESLSLSFLTWQIRKHHFATAAEPLPRRC
eukprot:COSAG05_NODE_23972_length_254_cov_1.225806_2_plen_45_part_01